MPNLMRATASVLLLTCLVGCGPVDATVETDVSTPPATSEDSEVSAESLNGFFDCLGIFDENPDGTRCVTNCILGLPDIQYVTACLVGICRLTLPEVTACLPELAEL
ncbi:hypothetical protein LXT21_25965 [Myxococcus sp. K38C18041901]|uniref:hypothetical protein n=1 Tax=Myxococcus guangdongensis TaxID=2906760 RepID=UPI0020A6E2FB|nr:hypothetical protein [Myxococcus guangdongensis]MCP3062240.1 hypothetical protein [Myxococcus guangdongensis]